MEVILGGIFLMLAAEQLAPLINFWANLSMFCSILWIRNLLQNTFYNIVPSRSKSSFDSYERDHTELM